MKKFLIIVLNLIALLSFMTSCSFEKSKPKEDEERPQKISYTEYAVNTKKDSLEKIELKPTMNKSSIK